MKLAENDLEETYFHSVRTGNDKIISYLFVCVGIALFFVLFAFAMNRTQTGTEPLPRETSRQTAEPLPEIGNLGEVTQN